MKNLVHNNRWFVWTLVLVCAIALITLAYIEYSKGEIDRVTAGTLQ